MSKPALHLAATERPIARGGRCLTDDERFERGESDTQRNSIKRLWLDYAITYFAIFSMTICGMLTYRAASQNFGEAGLSDYALIRRAIAFVQPALALGMAVALSRKVAACKIESRTASESAYLVAGLVLVLVSTLAYSIPVLLAPDFFAHVFFGSVEYRQHVMAMLPMLLGICLYFVCYAQLHGRFSMRWASAAQLLNVGLIPLVVILCTASVPAAFFWTGLTLSLVNLTGIGMQYRRAATGTRGLFSAIVELVRLGPPRIPGDIALAALMMLPATMVAHSYDARLGGLVAFCITLLTLAQTTSMPISTILLPQATQMLRSGRVAELRAYAITLVMAGLAITLCEVLFVWIATHLVLRICLGEYAVELPGFAKVIMLGALPLNCHTCLRSIIDAGKDLPVNARSSCLALASFFPAWLVAKYAHAEQYAAPIGLVFALCCLAALSSWEAWRILSPASAWARVPAEHELREAA